MDLPATLVDPSGEKRVVIDPRTYNQLRYGYGWLPASGAAPEAADEPESVVEPAPAPVVEPVVEPVAAPQLVQLSEVPQQ